MNRFLLLLTLSAILCSGCGIAVLTPVIVFDEPELTIYQIAAALTGCPESILRGIAFAESTYNPDAIGAAVLLLVAVSVLFAIGLAALCRGNKTDGDA